MVKYSYLVVEKATICNKNQIVAFSLYILDGMV